MSAYFLDRYDRFAVLGLGVSGVAASNALLRLGKQALASDARGQDQLGAALAQLHPGVEVVTGRNAFEGCQAAILSPGLKPSLPIIQAMRQAGLPLISEVELAFEMSHAPYLSITGTDGKTTTTSLTGHIFALDGQEHVVAGNIGTPLCDVVSQVSASGLIIAEISAFQLWSTHHFRSAACAITNIADDHLDYFDGDAQAYAQAKLRLLRQAQPQDCAVLNALDPTLRATSFSGLTLWVGFGQDPYPRAPHVLWSDGERFHGRFDGRSLGAWVERADELPLRGKHQHMNMLQAAALALSQGVSLDTIIEALETFEPLPHRMQRCGQLEGVTFWDDSKATNAHAALAGLRSLQGAIVPIVGGVDKQLPLAPLIDFVQERCPAVVLLGQLAPRLAQELISAGYPEPQLHRAQDMAQAVEVAARLARASRAAHVSLSPACSSFDMFDSYAHRGRVYQACVAALSAASPVNPAS